MRSYAMIGALALFAALPLSAQGKFRTGDIDPTKRLPTTVGDIVLGQERDEKAGKNRKSHDVPPGHLPPAGMCRVWIDGVPPGQQAAPTDCQTAVATKPANARVIWGDQSAFPGKGKGKFKKNSRADDGVFGIDRERDIDGTRKQEKRGRGLAAKRGKKG
jgi:hypothetical protein